MIRSPRERKEWAAHQVETSQGDYAPTSVLWGAAPPHPPPSAARKPSTERRETKRRRHTASYGICSYIGISDAYMYTSDICTYIHADVHIGDISRAGLGLR